MSTLYAHYIHTDLHVYTIHIYLYLLVFRSPRSIPEHLFLRIIPPARVPKCSQRDGISAQYEGYVSMEHGFQADLYSQTIHGLQKD